LQLNPLAEFDEINSVEVSKESERMDLVKLSIKNEDNDVRGNQF
jgi:hypothetical protein